MTSHPSPDGISERRTYNVALTEPSDIEHQPDTLTDAEFLAELAGESQVQTDGFRYAALGPKTRARLLALCTLVRGASEDRARLDWLEEHGEMLTRPQFPPHWEIKTREQSWICGHETSSLRRLIDAARTPNQDRSAE